MTSGITSTIVVGQKTSPFYENYYADWAEAHLGTNVVSPSCGIATSEERELFRRFYVEHVRLNYPDLKLPEDEKQ